MKKFLEHYKDYLEIIETEAIAKRLVLFVGSGISRLCGLPDWNSLSNKMINKCREDGYINYELVNVLQTSQFGSLQKISIIKQVYVKAKDEHNFFNSLCSFLELNLNESQDKKYKKLIKIFSSLECPIITTNADLFFHNKKFKGAKICEDTKELDNLNDFEKANIIHLHGCINNPETLIFTAEDYATLYSDKNFTDKLAKLFNNCNLTFLFIGYSLSDAELIRYIVGNSKIKENFKAYVLSGYYEHDDIIEDAFSKYYENIHIKQISFNLDKNYYDEEINILKRLLRKKNAYRNRYISTAIYKEIINKINNKPTQSSIKYVSKNYVTALDYIYETLNKSPFIIEWIKALFLNKNSIFNPHGQFVLEFDNLGNIRNKPWKALSSFIVASSKDVNHILDKYAAKIINDTLECIDNDASLKNNYIVMSDLIDLIFMDTKHFKMANYDIKSLIRILTDDSSDFTERMVSTMCTNSNTLMDMDENSFLTIVDVIISKSLINTDVSYIEDTFSSKLLVFYIMKLPLKYASLFYKYLKIILKERRIFEDDIGGFCFYPSDSLVDDSTAFILHEFKLSLNYLDNNDALTFINELKKESYAIKLNHKIITYICNIKLRQNFNIFDCKDILSKEECYTDLCALLLDNRDLYNDKGKKNKLISFLEGIKYSVSFTRKAEYFKDFMDCLEGVEPYCDKKDKETFLYWKNVNKGIIVGESKDYEDGVNKYIKKIKDYTFEQAISEYNNEDNFTKTFGLEEAVLRKIYDNQNLIFCDKGKIDLIPYKLLAKLSVDADGELSYTNYINFAEYIMTNNELFKGDILSRIIYNLHNIALKGMSNQEVYKRIVDYYLGINNSYLSFTFENYKELEDEDFASFLFSTPCRYFKYLFDILIRGDIKEKYQIALTKFNDFLKDQHSEEIVSPLICSLYFYLERLDTVSEYINKYKLAFESENYSAVYSCYAINCVMTMNYYDMIKQFDSYYLYLQSDQRQDFNKQILKSYKNHVLAIYLNKGEKDRVYDLMVSRKDKVFITKAFNEKYNILNDTQKINLKSLYKDISSFDSDDFKEIHSDSAVEQLSIILLEKENSYLWSLISKISKNFRHRIGSNTKLLLISKYGTKPTINAKCRNILLNIIVYSPEWFISSDRNKKDIIDIYSNFKNSDKDMLYKKLSTLAHEKISKLGLNALDD